MTDEQVIEKVCSFLSDVSSLSEFLGRVEDINYVCFRLLMEQTDNDTKVVSSTLAAMYANLFSNIETESDCNLLNGVNKYYFMHYNPELYKKVVEDMDNLDSKSEDHNAVDSKEVM